MIRDTFNFFRAEKKYTLVALIMLCVYAALFLLPASSVSHGIPEGPAVQEFKDAEQKLYDEVSKESSFEAFLEKRPEVKKLFGIMNFAAIGIFCLGLFVLFYTLFDPAWRKSWTVADLDDQTDWKISMVFKVTVLFLTFSVGVQWAVLLISHFFREALSLNLLILLQTAAVDFMCLYFMIYVVREAGGNWRDLGFRIPSGDAWKELRAGLIGYLGIFPVFVVVLVLLIVAAQFLSYDPPAHPLVDILLEEGAKKSSGVIAFSLVLATVIAPILEEVFFRGFCYPIFRQRWGKVPAMLASSFFFALIHHSLFVFWPIFILGLALAYIYEKRKGLLAPITLHLVHNTLFLGYFFFAKQIVASAG